MVKSIESQSSDKFNGQLENTFDLSLNLTYMTIYALFFIYWLYFQTNNSVMAMSHKIERSNDNFDYLGVF